eukprot:3232915-Amphidinium_carterae.1
MATGHPAECTGSLTQVRLQKHVKLSPPHLPQPGLYQFSLPPSAASQPMCLCRKDTSLWASCLFCTALYGPSTAPGFAPKTPTTIKLGFHAQKEKGHKIATTISHATGRLPLRLRSIYRPIDTIRRNTVMFLFQVIGPYLMICSLRCSFILTDSI